jgi:uncharacterized DUF497 family protein
MILFRWIEWNLEKIARHGIAVVEAERVVRSAARPYPRRIEKGKWQVIGRGQDDRWVQVIYVVDPDDTLFVIHAMPLISRRRRGRMKRKRKNQ